MEALQLELAGQREALEAVKEMAQQTPDDDDIRQMQTDLETMVQQLEVQIRASHPDLLSAEPSSSMQIGDTCRFRHTDGCWHLGRLQSIGSENFSMQFARPTRHHMLSAVNVAKELVQPYQDPVKQMATGQKVLAYNRITHLWEEAELCGETGSEWAVTFKASGDKGDLPIEDIESQLRPHREAEDEGVEFGFHSDVSSDSASEAEDARAAVDSDQLGAGAHQTAKLAGWEDHTRGIGSRMMLDMGYRIGESLGNRKAGILVPLQVSRYKPGAGLGAEGAALGPAEHTSKQKRKRGGRKARQRDKAKAAFREREAAKEEELQHELKTESTGVFALLNGHLGDGSAAAKRLKASAIGNARQLDRNGHGYLPDHQKASKSMPPAAKSRHSLVSGQEGIAAAQAKVTRLKEMAVRNAKDLVIAKQVSHKLIGAQKELKMLQDKHAKSLSDVQAKEKQKDWLKF